MKVIWAPRSTYMSGRMAAIMPMPMKESEPTTRKTSGVSGSACVRSSPKKSTRTTSMTAVCTRP